MEPLTLGAKAKGTSAFKKSTWLGTFVYFMERVEFQMLSEASVLHPLMGAGCKGNSRVSAEFRTTGLPKVFGKSRQKVPFKIQACFYVRVSCPLVSSRDTAVQSIKTVCGFAI